MAVDLIHCGTQAASVTLLFGLLHYGMVGQHQFSRVSVVLEIDEDLEKVEAFVWNVSFEIKNGKSTFTLKLRLSRTSGVGVELHVRPLTWQHL